MSVAPLVDLQLNDGGWAYGSNSAWTEPTAYSIRQIGELAQSVYTRFHLPAGFGKLRIRRGAAV